MQYSREQKAYMYINISIISSLNILNIYDFVLITNPARLYMTYAFDM